MFLVIAISNEMTNNDLAHDCPTKTMDLDIHLSIFSDKSLDRIVRAG